MYVCVHACTRTRLEDDRRLGFAIDVISKDCRVDQRSCVPSGPEMTNHAYTHEQVEKLSLVSFGHDVHAKHCDIVTLRNSIILHVNLHAD